MNNRKAIDLARRAAEKADRVADTLHALRIKVPAVHDVLVERARQIDTERYTPDEDARKNLDGDLTMAAVAYALHAPGDPCCSASMWPWDTASFKPKDRRRNLIRAAALLIAEIERMDG